MGPHVLGQHSFFLESRKFFSKNWIFDLITYYKIDAVNSMGETIIVSRLAYTINHLWVQINTPQTIMRECVVLCVMFNVIIKKLATAAQVDTLFMMHR